MLLTGYDLRGIFKQDLTYEIIERSIKQFLNYLKIPINSILLAVDCNKNNLKIVKFLQKKFDFDFIGLLPTPIFYYQVIQRKKPGIMITASHLPLKYSGLKFILKDGSPWKPNLKKISIKKKTEKIVFKEDQKFFLNKEVLSGYFEKLESIVNKKPKDKIFVNFDLNNFFLNSSLPYFRNFNIYHSSKAEIKVKSDLDNDRIYFFYKNKLIPTDIIFYFLALENKYQKLGVPIFFSQYLKNDLLKRKKKIFVIQTGHYHFKKAYKKYKIDLAFEPSGHFYFFKDLKTEAPYLALILFLLFLFQAENKKVFQKSLNEIKIFRFNIIPSKSFSFEKTINLLKNEFGLKLLKRFDGYLLGNQDFYLHLRRSQTENKIRISFEGKRKHLNIIKQWLNKKL